MYYQLIMLLNYAVEQFRVFVDDLLPGVFLYMIGMIYFFKRG